VTVYGVLAGSDFLGDSPLLGSNVDTFFESIKRNDRKKNGYKRPCGARLPSDPRRG
jgi:hypothetical protein